MARTLSSALETAQQGTQKTPHIHIVINSVDYSDRLLLLEHHEEAYRDRAVLTFRNNDGAFDSLDLRGYECPIAYGFYTGENVAEPNGDNAGNEYEYTPNLWVKSQQLLSAEGTKLAQLYCEGMWMYMREQRILAYGSAPYYNFTFEGTHTVYELIEAIIESALGWTLEATPSPDDGILNDFKPIFSVNEIPYESAASLLYRLIAMTKCYLRLKYDKTVQIVYPQESDSSTQSYYSDQAHYFYEYMEKYNLTIPNRVAVFCNQDDDGGWDNVMTGDTGAYSNHYDEVLEPFVDATITNQTDADNRAAAILARIKAEQLAGRLVIPYDCSLELYDNPAIYDYR